jgi:hypothetical protein
MNRSDFINMVEDKVELNRQVVGEVYELIDIFPYFQSAHLLLLKGLQNNADIKFEKQLRQSGIHIADREVLYNLLNKKPDSASSGDVKINRVTTDGDVRIDSQQTVIESARNSEQMISEIENSADLSHGEQNEEYNQVHSHSILISSDTEIMESGEVMIVMDEETVQDAEKIFYMDPGFSVPDYSDLLELETGEDKSFKEEEIIMPPREENLKTEGKKLLQSELIDKFIHANPRIEPVRDSSRVSAEDISKPFKEKEDLFVTETLARIYINQGYYSKAIDIYTELSLKFPEKSSYFASQIELVKVYLKK